MNTEIKTDRRIRKTKDALSKSLLILLKDKPISKVTVSELCEMADINRSSFYRYYDEPLALLKEIEREFLKEFIEIWENADGTDPLSKDLSIFIHKIYENQDFCTILFGPNGDPKLWDELLKFPNKISFDFFENNKSEAQEHHFELIFNFMLHGSCGIIETWINNGYKQQPDVIAELIKNLSAFGLSNYFKVM